MRRPTVVLRTAALATSAALVALSAAPGAAATPLAEGTATGLVLTVGGTPTDSGAYQVSDDGSGESSSGSRDPQIRLAGGQNAAQLGTVAQDAKTQVRNGRGSVVACAGLAGDGATVAEVGEGNCLSPGDNLRLNEATFALSDVVLVDGAAIPDEFPNLPPAELDPLLAGVDMAVQDALGAIGLDLRFDVGAIQSTCEADARRAVGDATLTDVGLFIGVQDQEFQVVDFPVNPPPNTKVVTELDQVVTAINDGLRTQLTNGLGGNTQPVSGPLGDAIDQINDNVIAQIAPQLAEVEKNLLDGTLNKQVRPRDRSIEVTALDLRVLPVATEPAGGDVLAVEIGKTTCATADAAAVAPPAPPAPPAPDVPTSVPAGVADSPTDDPGLPAEVALAGLAVVAGAVGVAAYRRRLAD